MTKTWYFHLVCAVILHLTLCRKHVLKMLFLRLTFLDKKIPKVTKSKNVKFDTKIKKRIITRYYFVSIKTFRYIISSWIHTTERYFRLSLSGRGGVEDNGKKSYQNLDKNNLLVCGLCLCTIVWQMPNTFRYTSIRIFLIFFEISSKGYGLEPLMSQGHIML